MKRDLTASLLAIALAGCNQVQQAPEPVAGPAAPALPAAQKDPLLSAVGIGVSDLAASTDFYVNVMGMEKIRSYHLDDMDEEVLGYPGAESYIVLMHWTDGSKRIYKDLPVKVVTRTRDPQALQEKIRAAGYEIIREFAPSQQVGGNAVGLAKDPDGYVLELLPLRAPAPPAGAETPKSK